ncbi:hypothetical protein [Carnimonas bestiolae]|uniref:hypothetical protein n=1 Tax=Carnimonas bestiolae TaxID=3402172 RepID=UPI003F4AB047
MEFLRSRNGLGAVFARVVTSLRAGNVEEQNNGREVFKVAQMQARLFGGHILGCAGSHVEAAPAYYLFTAGELRRDDARRVLFSARNLSTANRLW